MSHLSLSQPFTSLLPLPTNILLINLINHTHVQLKFMLKLLFLLRTPQKMIIVVGELLNQCGHSWRGCSEGALQIGSTVLERFYKEFERFLYENDCNCNSNNLVTNSLLSLFCPFLESKNKNQILSKLVVW